MKNEKYFVYILTDHRLACYGTPFYVGKGSGDRVQKHFWYKRHPNPHLGRKIKAIESEGSRVGVTLIHVDSEQEAFDLEAALIELLGRRVNNTGDLCNLTAGGEGISGYKHNLETRMKMSAKKRGPQSPEVIAARVSKIKGQKRTEEQKKRMSEAQKKRFEDPEVRRKFSELRKRLTADPEYRKRLSAAKKGIAPAPKVLQASAEARRKKALLKKLKEIEE